MDENPNPTAKILSICILILDMLVLHIRILFANIYAFIQLFAPPEERSVAGEKVLITGAGHGIGKELARQYGDLGAEVICVDINSQLNQETVDELKKKGIDAHAFTCDVSKREEVLELGKKVRAEVGDVTILVNNAGIMPTKRVEEHTENDIVRLFQINVFAHFWMFEAFLPRMVEKNYGHVVGIASMAGLMGIPLVAPYCGTKFAVRGIMEAMAEEYRQQGRSIKFTIIEPYMTDTGLCKKTKIKFPGLFGMQNPENVASEIIKAQRRGYREISVPNFLATLHNVGRLLPEKSQMLLVDFMDSGLLPVDD